MFLKKLAKKTYFIAEIGVNHNGKLALAKQMVDSAKKSGADAVKFQTFKADSLVSPKTPKVKYQRKSIDSKISHYEMIKSLEFSKENHIKIKNYCKKKSIEFISTPYDIESAKFLNKIGCNIFKTSSADIVDLELHEYLAKNKKTVIISTGMSTFEEIGKCIKIYKNNSNKNFILLHCVSNYPCSFNALNLNVIPLMRKKYNCIVGFSDHTKDYEAAKISVSLGGKLIEKHFTVDKKLPGPDQKASILPKNFKEMILQVRKTEIILGKKIKKCQKEELEMKKISRKSITLNKDIKTGQILKKEFVNLKRPGTGLYYSELTKIIGKKVKKDLKKNYQPNLSDIKR
jgi:N,N'-diacetyllegionaminate synthase